MGHDPPQEAEDVARLCEDLRLVGAEDGNAELNEYLPPHQSEQVPQFVDDLNRQVFREKGDKPAGGVCVWFYIAVLQVLVDGWDIVVQVNLEGVGQFPQPLHVPAKNTPEISLPDEVAQILSGLVFLEPRHKHVLDDEVEALDITQFGEPLESLG